MNMKMNAERWALTAVVALGIYGLACVSLPSPAWSPDSSRIVLPVMGKEDGCVDLVMIDTVGNRVREVARYDERQRPMPAAWSPDGQWLAYLRLTLVGGVTKEDGAILAAWAVVLQSAADGQERVLYRQDLKDPVQLDDEFIAPVLQWRADSKALIFSGAYQEEEQWLLSVDLNGRMQRLTRFEEMESLALSSVSPNGEWVCYLRGLDGARVGEARGAVELRVRRLADGAETSLDKLSRPDAASHRPAWTPDSRRVYYGVVEPRGEGAHAARLCRYEAATGKKESLWVKDSAAIHQITVAAQTGAVAVWWLEEKKVGDKVEERWFTQVIASDGAALPTLELPAGREMPAAACPVFSPDGKWLAFTLVEGPCPGGGVLSVANGKMRLYMHTAQAEDAEQGAEDALEAAMQLTGIRQEMKRLTEAEPDPAARLQKELKFTETIAPKYEGPFFEEFFPLARLTLARDLMDELGHDGPNAALKPVREEFIRQAEAFLKLKPNHPIAKTIREALNDARKAAAAPATPTDKK